MLPRPGRRHIAFKLLTDIAVVHRFVIEHHYYCTKLQTLNSLHRSKSHSRLYKGHSHNVFSVAFSADDRHALSGSLDKTLGVWDVERGELLAQFAAFTDGELVSITPDGHYNASTNGHRHVNFSQGDRVAGMDTAPERSRYFQPERVAARLGGTAFAAMPPILTISQLAFSSGILNAEESATLSLTLKNTGPGPARDVEVLLAAEGSAQGLAFAPSTPVSKVEAGDEVTVQIPVHLGRSR